MVVSLCLLGIFIVVVVGTLLANTTMSNVVSPFTVFSSVFAFVYFAVPMMANIAQLETYLPAGNDELTSPLCIALGLALFYYIAASAGYLTTGAAIGRTDRKVAVLVLAASKPAPEERGLITWLCILQGAGTAISLYLLVPLMLQDYGEFMINRISILAGMGYALSASTLGIGTALLLSAPVFAKGGSSFGKPMKLAYLLLGTNLVMAAAQGGRSTALIGILYVILSAQLLKRRPIKLRKVGIAFVTVFLVVTGLGVLRVSVKSKAAIDDTMIEGGVTATKLADEVNRNFAQLELLGFLIENDAAWSYSYGSTYASILALPIPRKLWLDKPTGAGPEMMNILRPGSYDLNGKYNTSVTTGCVTEAYMSGGIAGIILIGIIHGVLLGLVTQYGTRTTKRYQYVLYLLYAFLLGESIVYGESFGAVSRFAPMIFSICLYCWFSKAVRGMSNRNRTRLVSLCGTNNYFMPS
jgi:hypothetical protein